MLVFLRSQRWKITKVEAENKNSIQNVFLLLKAFKNNLVISSSLQYIKKYSSSMQQQEIQFRGAWRLVQSRILQKIGNILNPSTIPLDQNNQTNYHNNSESTILMDDLNDDVSDRNLYLSNEYLRPTQSEYFPVVSKRQERLHSPQKQPPFDNLILKYQGGKSQQPIPIKINGTVQNGAWFDPSESVKKSIVDSNLSVLVGKNCSDNHSQNEPNSCKIETQQKQQQSQIYESLSYKPKQFRILINQEIVKQQSNVSQIKKQTQLVQLAQQCKRQRIISKRVKKEKSQNSPSHQFYIDGLKEQEKQESNQKPNFRYPKTQKYQPIDLQSIGRTSIMAPDTNTQASLKNLSLILIELIKREPTKIGDFLKYETCKILNQQHQRKNGNKKIWRDWKSQFPHNR